MHLQVFQMVEAFVLVRVGSSETLNFMRSVKEELSETKGVKDVYGVFGRYDFIITMTSLLKWRQKHLKI